MEERQRCRYLFPHYVWVGGALQNKILPHDMASGHMMIIILSYGDGDDDDEGDDEEDDDDKNE